MPERQKYSIEIERMGTIEIFAKQKNNIAPKTDLVVNTINVSEFGMVKLPKMVKTNVDKVQMKVDSKVDTFLAIALPRVVKDKLEFDFPLVSRAVLKDKPSAKMAIRLLKQDRDEKAGPMAKLWSHALKTAVMHEVGMLTLLFKFSRHVCNVSVLNFKSVLFMPTFFLAAGMFPLV